MLEGVLFRTYTIHSNYRGATIYYCESLKSYNVSKFTEDKKNYLFKSKDYKSLKWCKNFVDKYYEEHGEN